MTDEEIGRFASVLEDCGRIRKMMVRDEAALSDGEHDAPEAGPRPRARRASARRFGEGG